MKWKQLSRDIPSYGQTKCVIELSSGILTFGMVTCYSIGPALHTEFGEYLPDVDRFRELPTKYVRAWLEITPRSPQP